MPTPNNNFNAQHSPMGAFMSLTCGHHGSRGGIGVQIGKPANHDLFIGVKEGDRFAASPLKCLPFFKTTRNGGAGAADFQVEQAGPAEQNVAPKITPYASDEIRRDYRWASDAWTTDDFTFTIHTPFGEIPDPAVADPAALRDALLPAVVAELVVDNARGARTRTAFVSINFNEPGWRPLDNCGPGRVGFGLHRDIGLLAECVESKDEPILFCRWSPDGGLIEPVAHRLGSCPGVLLEVPAGERRTLRLAFGCHLDRIVTTGLEARYYYTRHFGGLEEVLIAALDRGDPSRRTRPLDEQLIESGLTADQQFLIAHATRSYYGSTQLLDVAGEPYWVVNEGEYCMMNTLDLSVDQMFWELKQNPWVVRNLLDNFARRYSYVDQLQSNPLSSVLGGEGQGEGEIAWRFPSPLSVSTTPSPQPSPPSTGERELFPGGISFTHDQGAHNHFSPPGTSSYELPDLTGCFSHMTGEQLCNWVLIAAQYGITTRDDDWLRANRHVLQACLDSLVARGGPCGMLTYDSARCGTGREITTYDSLDHSLAQACNNLYMAVKMWAAFGGLAHLFRRFDDGDAQIASDYAGIQQVEIERAVLALRRPDGTWPAVFDEDSPGHQSRILPAIEGLLYAQARGDWMAGDGADWYAALKDHTVALLLDPDRRNLFPDGGIKLSSTSSNSWMSKIAVFQHVAREVFALDDDPAVADLFARADAAHVKWQVEGSGYWACSDQFVNGIAKGSRYYPRIITAALWLAGRRTGRRADRMDGVRDA